LSAAGATEAKDPASNPISAHSFIGPLDNIEESRSVVRYGYFFKHKAKVSSVFHSGVLTFSVALNESPCSMSMGPTIGTADHLFKHEKRRHRLQWRLFKNRDNVSISV